MHLFLEELDVVRLVNNVASSISSVVRTLKINRMLFKFQFKDLKVLLDFKNPSWLPKGCFPSIFLVSRGIQQTNFMKTNLVFSSRHHAKDS